MGRPVRVAALFVFTATVFPGNLILSDPQVIARRQIHPESRRIPEITRKMHRRIHL